MIQVFDVQIIEGMEFEDYLKMPGLSYSGILSDGVKIEETEKMKFGSLVDCYLFEPKRYSGEKFNLVRPVAKAVQDKLGPLITLGKRQLVVTCILVVDGIYVRYKGRVDLFAGNIVIDMKVSELDLLSAIRFFGYDKQVSGYAIPLKAPVSLIISVHPKKYTTSIAPIATNTSWWERKVLEYGKPVDDAVKMLMHGTTPRRY
jgi:hypothetical protein